MQYVLYIDAANYFNLPVNKYCESALNAASHIQRFSSSFSSRHRVKSEVFHIRAVASPEVVTNNLELQITLRNKKSD